MTQINAEVTSGSILKITMDNTLIGASQEDAAKLRKLAAWYRKFSERAGNAFIWESRLLLAEDLEREAARIELEISESRND